MLIQPRVFCLPGRIHRLVGLLILLGAWSWVRTGQAQEMEPIWPSLSPAAPRPSTEDAEQAGPTSMDAESAALPSSALPPRSGAPDWSATDWTASALAGLAGLAVASVVGFGIGYGVSAATCVEDPDPDEFFGGCDFNAFAAGVAGAIMLAPIGEAGGIYWRGRHPDYSERPDGSFWATFGGVMLGVAAASAITYGMSEVSSQLEKVAPVVGAGSFLVLPALGGTAAYYLSASSPEPGPALHSLLRFDLAAGLALGLPLIRMTPRGEQVAWSVTLLAGTF